MALGNIFRGGLQNITLVLSLSHGCYGIGGPISPLITTASVVAAKTGYEQGPDPVVREGETAKAEFAFLGIVPALPMYVVLLGAIFIFAYQGAEVSISGWVISFLFDARGGDPAKVGYVAVDSVRVSLSTTLHFRERCNARVRNTLRGMVAISASGSLGGAMAPFLTGLLA